MSQEAAPNRSGIGGDGIGEAAYVNAIDAGHSREIALLISEAFRNGFNSGYCQCELDYVANHIEP